MIDRNVRMFSRLHARDVAVHLEELGTRSVQVMERAWRKSEAGKVRRAKNRRGSTVRPVLGA